MNKKTTKFNDYVCLGTTMSYSDDLFSKNDLFAEEM